ncbi:MAG: hypothetical protein MJK12_02055, partial [Colwellia sp.]|nr:hypothetical protein [Colwellia sp.]
LAQDCFFLQQYHQSLSLLEKADSLVVKSSPQKQQILQHIARVNQRMKNKVNSKVDTKVDGIADSKGRATYE